MSDLVLGTYNSELNKYVNIIKYHDVCGNKDELIKNYASRIIPNNYPFATANRVFEVNNQKAGEIEIVIKNFPVSPIREKFKLSTYFETCDNYSEIKEFVKDLYYIKSAKLIDVFVDGKLYNINPVIDYEVEDNIFKTRKIKPLILSCEEITMLPVYKYIFIEDKEIENKIYNYIISSCIGMTIDYDYVLPFGNNISIRDKAHFSYISIEKRERDAPDITHVNLCVILAKDTINY